ncbi:hypothetical protein S7335_999 [Synechococcus sp. PCC 7335]|nr:hypothetical protein S7335_999 [Synechococcus sp. PCC 7335]
MKARSAFASAALGTALHAALAQFYQDWHYQEPLPSDAWLQQCWENNNAGLTDKQLADSWQLMQQYYERELVPVGTMQRPLATEGRLQGTLQANDIEFKLVGRYDRIDFVDGGLELIDYKSAKSPQLPSANEIDLQLGLYYLALEQRYGQSLKQMTLLFLRTGDRVSYEATEVHKQQVQTVIGELARGLREEEGWQARCGQQCRSCGYARYCPAVQPEAEPVVALPRKLQLCLSL